MITGYNTDVEYEGVIYHVQTEDKGIKTPVILSLVYVDGAIVGSKRTPYDDLIASGFDEAVLAKRLQRQHKLICAAVHAGRINELKRMSEGESRGKTPEQERRRESGQSQAEEEAPEPRPLTVTMALCANCGAKVAPDHRFCGNCGSPQAASIPLADDAGADRVDSDGPVLEASSAKESPTSSSSAGEVIESEASASLTSRVDEVAGKRRKRKALRSGTVRDNRREIVPPLPPKTEPPEATRATSYRFSISETKEEEALRVSLLEEPTLRSGASVTLRVRVTRAVGDEREPVAKARVTLKILGTTFLPRSFFSSTDKDGLALISAQLPRFIGGRAAILIRAEIDAETTELRRIILPA